MVIPVRQQLFDAEGNPLLDTPDVTTVLDTETAVLARLEKVRSKTRPVASAFRGVSAPVIVEQEVDIGGDGDAFADVLHVGDAIRRRTDGAAGCWRRRSPTRTP